MILIDNRNTTDPYANLAIEEYLLRSMDCSAGDYLLLYINEPCVVLGKNQSIYKEVNAKYIHSNLISLCRRISGGGAVYHDGGNLSFAFISKFEDYKINNYKHFNKPIVDALIKAGIPAEMDGRNNILCNGRKISGNAQFTNRKNIISHGTLLFNADLDKLREALKMNRYRSDTRAVASVRSPVINIGAISTYFKSIQDLKEYLQDELAATQTRQFTDTEWNEINLLADTKFRTNEWIFNRSPKTTISHKGIAITIEDGLITEVRGEENLQILIGLPFNATEIKKALGSMPNALNLIEYFF